MKKIIILILLMPLAIAGCAEYRTVNKQASSPIPYDVTVGDKVLVVLVDDQYNEFVVTDISDAEIAGKDVRIKYKDIAFIKKKEIDSDETIKSVLAGTGMGLLIAFTGLLLFAIAAAP
jgi:hypothetical protein